MIDRPFTISLRQVHHGQMHAPLRRTSDALAARHRIVLLVHGYNSSPAKAYKAFLPFKWDLLDRAPALTGQVGFVTWPGYWSNVFSPTSYHWMVRRAKDCAAELQRYIEERADITGARPTIVVVAHSLGCRLVLEALKELNPAQQAAVQLVLMAAAYPVNLASQNAMKLRPLRSVVLFSSSDSVLRGPWFALGEKLAGDAGGGWPEAVGVWGRPMFSAWLTREPMDDFGHGTY